MRRGKFPKSNHQRGYMLITLMLAVALMTIALLAVLPAVRQQVQREREEELRHRGTAYMRAIQHFHRKLGRYPARIEDLESTNNMRFLRKRYKDPINRDPATGKEREFKFLHQQDISLNNGPVLGQPPGSGLGFPPPNAPGTQPRGNQPTSSTVTQPAAGDDTVSNTDNGGDPNAAVSSSNSGSPSSSGLNGPTFGGGAILGVASMSKAKGIHVFFGKSHYNDWLFIYLEQADRGGLLTGPVNPGMPTGNLSGPGPATLPGTVPNPGSQQTLPTTPPQNPAQTPPEQ